MRKPVVLITGAGGEIGHGLITSLAKEATRPIITLDVNPLAPELARLVQREFQGSILDTNPGAMIVGPKVLLADEFSASDGDLVTWRFKTYKMGPVIGKRTWGGVVGIAGTLPLLDGGFLNKPEFSRYDVAVAGAPLTNMVSMYSLIYKNTGGGNGAIFESSQGRFLGGYWDNWEAYYRNSPVFFAANVKTPLMILHNDKDGAVDFTQGVEYFNTLRRLGKPVWMLEYLGENHGLRKPANMQDYTVRVKEFFDHYLKGQPMAGWMKDGVPRLSMEDHLKERLLKKADTKPAPAEEIKK